MLRGTRVILPAVLQAKAVELAHVGHHGIVKTKKLLHEKVWLLRGRETSKELSSVPSNYWSNHPCTNDRNTTSFRAMEECLA